MLRGCLLLLAALLACASAYEDIPVPPQESEAGVAASEGGAATWGHLFHGDSSPKSMRKVPQHAQVPHHYTRHKRQGLPETFIIPGGAGEGPWGEWGEVSPCSRTCGGGVARQKRICLRPEDQSQCKGGDTKYFSCQTQDCPDGSGDFRAEQCAALNDKHFRYKTKYNWVLANNRDPNPCTLICMPSGGARFSFRYKGQVTDGTRCYDNSFDVCVNGSCQPIGCDMMLNSTAREDKCGECRGKGTSCRTIDGLLDSQDLMKGFNDIMLIPAGSTSIIIEEVKPSRNYLALRAKNGTYYLNGHYHIDYPRTITIAGALWTYERSQQDFVAPNKLRCLGPTTEPLFLSIFLQDKNKNVGIRYEYSVPNNTPLPTDKRYNWVHEQFTPCSASCGGGFKTHKVSCKSRDKLEIVEDSLCDEGLKPPTNQLCNPEPCPARWVGGPWGECTQSCGSNGHQFRLVNCQKITANGEKPDEINAERVVPDKECFGLVKPRVIQKCNEYAPCPTWFVEHWNPCNELCEQTRRVVCQQKWIDGTVQLLDDETCTEEKPVVEQACTLPPCGGVNWYTSSWSGCNTCTSKFRTRMVICATKNFLSINDSFCRNSSRPVDHEACNIDALPPCDVQWYTTDWDKCSVNCGEGTQTRKVFCGIYKSGFGVEIVENDKCANLTKYHDTKPCNVPKEECPSQWLAGPWSECSKAEDGEQYRRVMCFRDNKKTDDCDFTTVLDSTQICNNHTRTPAEIAGDENATVTGKLFSPLLVRCHAYGYPPPTVYWYRGFDEKAILLHNEMEYELRGYDLIIKHLTIDNLGQYKCGAYNGLGLAASWKVVVQACKPAGLFSENEWLVSGCAEAPTTAQPPNTTKTTTNTTSTTEPVSAYLATLFWTLNIGDSLGLTCHVGGFPEPKVYWTRDGITIHTYDRITITDTVIRSDLTVRWMSDADSGRYTCHASNQYSSQSDFTQVYVKQRVVPATK